MAKNGVEVSVFEQSPEFVAAGAGIQLSPNCTRVLHDLGLESALREPAFLPQGTQFRHWRTGKVISESILGEAVLQRYGAPYYHIHRGDFLEILAAKATESPNIEIHLNASVSEFSQDESGVSVLVKNVRHQGDVLIGADGIHSAIHARLWGDETPRFTGNVAWRALVPTSSLPRDLVRPMSTIWWGPEKHFVHYYVCNGEFVNCVCVVEKAGWEVESWVQPGDLDELKQDFAGWHDDIQQLINHAEEGSLYKWALFDRAPMAQWGQGRVTLLGDACHPTLPFMAQGAAMAIEDAAVLTSCLLNASDIEESLQIYEELRRPRTASIQAGSRRNAKVFHLAGAKAWARDLATSRAGGHAMDNLFKYNALEVGTASQPEKN